MDETPSSRTTMSKTPSTAQTTFQDGIDSLWRFQLRREHRELLQCQEQQLKLIQTIREEHSNLRKEVEERCSTLEARMLEFEEAEKKDQQAFERHDEEMRILRAEFGVEIEKQERQLSEAQAGDEFMDAPPPRIIDAASTDVPAHVSRIESVAYAMPSSIQAVPKKRPKLGVAGITRGAAASAAYTPNQSVSHRETAGHTSSSRTRSRSRTTSQEPATVEKFIFQTPTPAARPKQAPATTTLPSTQIIKLGRLHQGHRSLKTYHERADRTWDSLPEPKEEKFEIQFIAEFMKGITDEVKRNILADELMQRHQSRTKKDGKVEILCKWKNVGKGMQDCGLFNKARPFQKKNRPA